MTKVEAIVELNPVLDHVDAMKDNEKVVTSRAAQGRTDEAGEGEARAVNMTVKATDEEGEEMETLGERSEIIKAINRMREEPWQRLEYHDSEVMLKSALDSQRMLTNLDAGGMGPVCWYADSTSAQDFAEIGLFIVQRAVD